MRTCGRRVLPSRAKLTERSEGATGRARRPRSAALGAEADDAAARGPGKFLERTLGFADPCASVSFQPGDQP